MRYSFFLTLAFLFCPVFATGQTTVPLRIPLAHESSAPETVVPLQPSGPVRLVNQVPLGQETTLAGFENGLTLIVCENRLSSQVAIRCFVRNTGSAFETDRLGCGLSTLLVQQIDGNAIAGSAGKESIRFGTDVPAEQFSEAVYRFVETLFNPRFSATDSANETAFAVAERGPVLRSLLEESVYSSSPLRIPVEGYPDLVRTVLLKTLTDYHRERFCPNSMVFVVCGDVGTDEVLGLFGQAFAGIPRGVETVVPSLSEPPQLASRSVVCESDGGVCELAVGWPGVRVSNPDRFALDLIAVILAEGNTSRLARRLLADRSLALQCNARSETAVAAEGYFAVEASCLNENRETVVRTILEEIGKLREEPVPAEELAKAKKQKEIQNVFERQTISATADRLGENFLATGDPLYEEKYLRAIRAVSAETIRETARKYFAPERLNQILIAPRGQMPKPPAASPAEKPGEIQQARLPNGIRLLTRRQPALPMVSIQAVVLGGALVDTSETAGRASLFAAMLNQGTAKSSAREIAARAENLGGGFHITSDAATTVLSLTILSADFQPGLDLLAECILSPTFPDPPFGSIQSQRLGFLKQRSGDPLAELSNFFAINLPETTPYHISPYGTAETVSRLTVASLRDYYQQCFVPENIVFAVFGDIDPKKAEAALSAAFGKMRGSVKAKPIVLERNNMFLQPIEGHLRTEKQTAAILLGYPIGSLADSRETAILTILKTIFGGYRRSAGWLARDLKNSGLALSTSSELWIGPAPGYFVLGASCPPENLQAVQARLEQCVERAKAGWIEPEELLAAQREIVAAHSFGNATLEEQARSAALGELFGLGLREGDDFPERINAVTLEEVVSLARKYLTRRILVTASGDDRR